MFCCAPPSIEHDGMHRSNTRGFRRFSARNTQEQRGIGEGRPPSLIQVKFMSQLVVISIYLDLNSTVWYQQERAEKWV
jgi:hypothetical protein